MWRNEIDFKWLGLIEVLLLYISLVFNILAIQILLFSEEEALSLGYSSVKQVKSHSIKFIPPS
jgi:hypothetical protein